MLLYFWKSAITTVSFFSSQHMMLDNKSSVLNSASNRCGIAMLSKFIVKDSKSLS